jgi:hypothetical protein
LRSEIIKSGLRGKGVDEERLWLRNIKNNEIIQGCLIDACLLFHKQVWKHLESIYKEVFGASVIRTKVGVSKNA